MNIRMTQKETLVYTKKNTHRITPVTDVTLHVDGWISPVRIGE